MSYASACPPGAIPHIRPCSFLPRVPGSPEGYCSQCFSASPLCFWALSLFNPLSHSSSSCLHWCSWLAGWCFRQGLLWSSGVHWADLVHIVFQGVHILLRISFYLSSAISLITYSLFSHFHSYCQDLVCCWAGCAASPSPGIHCKARTLLRDAFHFNALFVLWHWTADTSYVSYWYWKWPRESVLHSDKIRRPKVRQAWNEELFHANTGFNLVN